MTQGSEMTTEEFEQIALQPVEMQMLPGLTRKAFNKNATYKLGMVTHHKRRVGRPSSFLRCVPRSRRIRSLARPITIECQQSAGLTIRLGEYPKSNSYTVDGVGHNEYRERRSRRLDGIRNDLEYGA